MSVPPSSGVRVPLVVVGILFAVLWIAAHVVWVTMSLMGSVMANDSGAASTDQHMSLIIGMLVGQVLAASADIPGGLAFFWRGSRKWLLVAFAILFVGGALCQVGAFMAFFSAVSAHH